MRVLAFWKDETFIKNWNSFCGLFRRNGYSSRAGDYLWTLASCCAHFPYSGRINNGAVAQRSDIIYGWNTRSLHFREVKKRTRQIIPLGPGEMCN